jgi:2-polyprenyl-3-methyl-5-hydroxy-6-metoxy-1,4-benzoquinol methylase
MEKCKICGSEVFETAYEGHIRIGKFGNLSDRPLKVTRCGSCLAQALPSIIEDQAAFYESQEYRQEVDEGADVGDYFRLHDGEQVKHFAVAGTSIFRDKVVADIGCGAGSFLDYIKGVCKNAIGVEPALHYRRALSERGYASYPYTSDALREKRNMVDIAVSFSVIEHIQYPLEFLREIYALLKPGGKVVVSTPNAEDILLDFIPDAYAPFFYRKAHLWYFNARALENLLRAAGFQEIRILPFHRFGFGNFITWVRDKRPAGDKRFDSISSTIDAVWKGELERTFRCDYLYAIATKTDMQEQ